ncbi:TetR/AcrR family transcriptional regulator C-terminal domain-containing protein [Flindersiella endophytica]
MTEQTGAGDLARSIELLWRTQQPPRRGPRPRFSVDQIAEAAIAIADGEGLPAVSMRRMAERLGVTAMSLYAYVPSKSELLDVMLDAVYGELDVDAGGAETGWRARLELVARQNWQLYLRHPWLLQVATSRPVLGPNEAVKYDYELRAVDGIGLGDVDMDLVVSLVTDYVHGAVRGAIEAARAERRSGLTDEEWWRAAAPLLEKVFDPDRYPTATRVGVAAGAAYNSAHDPARSFEFGLQRVLDGIEAYLGPGRHV